MNPYEWTRGCLFMCAACHMQYKRQLEAPRCLKCGRSGFKNPRVSLERVSWAMQPITYLNDKKQLEEGMGKSVTAYQSIR